MPMNELKSKKFEIWKIGQPRIPVRQTTRLLMKNSSSTDSKSKINRPPKSTNNKILSGWPIYLANTLEKVAEQQLPSYRKEIVPKPEIRFTTENSKSSKLKKRQTFPRRTEQLLKDKSANPVARKKLMRSKTLGLIGDPGKTDFRMRRLSTQDNMRAELLK